MPLPREMGKYLARPTDWTCGESDNGKKLLQFVSRFDLMHYWNGAEWEDVSGDHMSVTGYFYLIKSDGQPNASTIDNLKLALGWDGRSVSSLAEGDWSGHDVQITVDKEEYQGKWNVKVKWITSADTDPRGGGLQKPEPSVVKSLDQKYGSLFRAIAGPTTPSRPASTPATTPTMPKVGPIEAAKRAAWGEFNKKWLEHIKEFPDEVKLRDEKWKSLLQDAIPGCEASQLSEKEWLQIAELTKNDYSAALGTLIPV